MKYTSAEICFITRIAALAMVQRLIAFAENDGVYLQDKNSVERLKMRKARIEQNVDNNILSPEKAEDEHDGLALIVECLDWAIGNKGNSNILIHDITVVKEEAESPVVICLEYSGIEMAIFTNGRISVENKPVNPCRNCRWGKAFFPSKAIGCEKRCPNLMCYHEDNDEMIEAIEEIEIVWGC